jgi:hypothetical protein
MTRLCVSPGCPLPSALRSTTGSRQYDATKVTVHITADPLIEFDGDMARRRSRVVASVMH